MITPQGSTIPKSYKLLFTCTNNIVAYEALVIGIKLALEWKVIELQVYGDSQLVINQINDEYHKKDDKLIPYKNIIEYLKKKFTLITFEQVPREKNKAADIMVTLASLLQMSNQSERYKFLVEEMEQSTFDPSNSYIIFLLVGHDSPWYGSIYTYLKDQTLPLEKTQNQKGTS